jgi:phenylacetate-CoA ligase
VVQGRSTDFLKLPDGTVKHALSVIYPLRALPEIRAFRVLQREDYSVTVEIQPVDRTHPLPEQRIRMALHPVLGHDLPINVSVVSELEPAASGKHRYVRSQAGHQEHDGSQCAGSRH